MEELEEEFKELNVSDEEDDSIEYEYIHVFKNPTKLPINEVFIERTIIKQNSICEVDEEMDPFVVDVDQFFRTEHEVVAALDKSWIPEYIAAFEYYPYNFNVSAEENHWFKDNNKNYIQFLEYLLNCDYHQFWCSILFNDQVRSSLKDFLLNPMPNYLYRDLSAEFKSIYMEIFQYFYLIYRRLITFRESETEYMSESVGVKYLIENKLLNLPTILTLTMLYRKCDADFIHKLAELYFSNKDQKQFIEKEVEAILEHFSVVFQMIVWHVCGFPPDATVIPLSIEERPKLFSLNWIESVVGYFLNMVDSLYCLLFVHQPAVRIALNMGFPEMISSTYEKIFDEIYGLLEERDDLLEQPDLANRVWYEIGLARSFCVDNFHSFISYCLHNTLEKQGDPAAQEEFVEFYINTLTSALEYEIFICDYNVKYNVSSTSEMFAACYPLDTTRTDYIVTSINNFERNDFIKQHKGCKIETAFASKVPKPMPPKEPEIEPIPGCSFHTSQNGKSEEEIEEQIQEIIGMFPHLGDKFILKCLEAYNFDSSEVINAILEENLPPHITEIPCDQIRIPPEPEPPKPVLAYQGKKPDYADTMELLNDRTEHSKIKTYILDGIQYDNRYDNSDDEFDDREVELGVPDYTPEISCEGYDKPNEDDLVSDTSYSDNEFDDEGKPVEQKKPKNAFCEDPAVIRARYEARRGARGGGHRTRDVVGKPKGQGQDKNVVQNRQKKNVNKSSRANHNRKSGAQWKRSRGMLPA